MTNLSELTALMNDSLTNKVALFSADAAKYTDQAIREAFFDILGEDKLTWQGFRNHKNEIYTVIENVLSTNLPSAWENSPFYQNMVDIKNGALGDKNEFIVEDNSTLVASRFSGNHWDTNRQKVQGKREFSVPTEWIYIRVYDDLERFLKGTITLPEMIAKLQKGLANEIDSRIYAAFNGVGTYLPSKFQEKGTYDRDTLNDLIQRVQIASQKEVVIAGTRRGLAHIADGINSAWIADSQKEEVATTGALVTNIGLPAKAILIPQTFIRGTYDFKVNDNVLYILPENSKIVKLYYEGDVRARDLSSQDTHDQTIDTQVQVKTGTGVVCDTMIGRYEIV